MELDPNLVWSLGIATDLEFAAAPTPPGTLGLAHVRFGDGASDPLNVPLTLDAYDPALLKPPVKVIGVYAKAPVPDGADLAWYTDPANAFPCVLADFPVPDPSQPTTVTLSYSGPEIFDPRRYQVIEGHTP